MSSHSSYQTYQNQEPHDFDEEEMDMIPQMYDHHHQEAKEQLWKVNDRKANKNGPHSTIYWVKKQNKNEDGSYKGGKWRTSTKYIGDWKNNKKNGFGIKVFQNGDKYEGGWKDNRMNG